MSSAQSAILIQLRPITYGDTGLAYYQLSAGDLIPVFVIRWVSINDTLFALTDEHERFTQSELQIPADLR